MNSPPIDLQRRRVSQVKLGGARHVLFDFPCLHGGIREPLDQCSGSEIGGIQEMCGFGNLLVQ